MAITYRRLGTVGLPTDLGMNGLDCIRLTGDASATTILVTLGSDSPIKTIRGCVVGYASSHNIPVAGVASTTGFTITFAAAPGAVSFDAFIWGDGR